MAVNGARILCDNLYGFVKRLNPVQCWRYLVMAGCNSGWSNSVLIALQHLTMLQVYVGIVGSGSFCEVGGRLATDTSTTHVSLAACNSVPYNALPLY